MRKPGLSEAGNRWDGLRRFRRVLASPGLVPLAVRANPRLAPAVRRIDVVNRRLAGVQAAVTLRAAALAARPAIPRRRAHLQESAARLPVPPTPPSVALITLEPWGASPWRAVADAAPEVVVSLSRGARVTALAEAVAAATGDVLCFVPDPVDAPTAGWLRQLTAVLGDGVVAATPTLVHPAGHGRSATPHDLLVRSAGFEVHIDHTGAPQLANRGSGQRPDVAADAADVAAAPLRALAVTRTAYVEVGGLVDIGHDDAAAVDLVARLRERGGRVRHVPQALAYDDRPVTSRRDLHRPIDPAAPAWAALLDRCGPALAQAGGAPRPRRRWAITTAVPSQRVAERWGDWHFAEALARSLRRQGEDALVQTLDQADRAASRSCDVHLVLHGLGTVRRTPGQRHVLWVISHPESLSIDDCDAADLVLVASAKFAAHLREQTTTPVEVLLQATDHRRFAPHEADPRHRHDVTVVAKTRDVLRPVVVDAIAAGLRPAIYGSGWRSLVDPDLVVADHVDNSLLPTIYSSAGVVLNDHWETMRSWGFVSNRLFDVLACEVPVISDEMEGLDLLFGDAVSTYRTVDELRTLVNGALGSPAEARARARAGRAAVLASHTFDHRAAALVELLEHHGLRTKTRMETFS